MSPAAGSKRSRSNDPDEGLPYGDADPTPSLKEDRKEKPKDWRAAFLEEDEAEERRQRERRRERERGEDRGAPRRSTGRERSRSRDRSRDTGGRGGGGVGGRDRERRGDSREIDSARDRSTSHHRTHSPSGSSHRRRTRTPSPSRGGPPRSYPPRGGYSAAPARGGGGVGGRGDSRGGSDSYRGRGGAGGNRGGRGDYNYHPNARPYNNQYPVSDPSQRNNSNAPPPPPPPPPSAPIVVEPPKPEIIEEIPDEEELDPEEALAARRRKRQEILERFQQENQSTTTSAAGTPGPSESGGLSVAAVGTPISRGLSPSASFSLAKEDESSVPQGSTSTQAFQSVPDANEEISAADYDPSADRQAEEIRRHQNETEKNDATVSAPVVGVVQPKVEEVEEEEDDDDDDDMFSDVVKVKKVKPVAANGSLAIPVARIAPIAATSAATLSDNWDDSDGYYRITPGEVIDDGRYQIYTTLGKGMFSAVVKARVLKGSPTEPEGIDVAIKIIRSQESMYKAGLKEIQILNKLRAADPEDKKHLVRLERTFEYRGHLCMVFENLSMNLRDVIKRFGKDVGLNIKAVRAYAHQMFLALSLMQKCRIMHADIKPDNILVTENKSFLKICDLGSASDESENEITPYLVSRFYRAPEIILGLPYDCSLDIWSIGCTLFELYTGKILFPGRTNNQMLLHHMELKGKFNHRIIKKSQFGEMHFDETMNFISVEVDKITGQNTSKILSSFKARDLKARLLPSANAQHKMKDDELKMLLGFVDLLDKCLMLDSSKRITPREALLHPFIRGG